MPVPHKVTNDYFVPPIDQLITERENVYEIIDYEFIYERFNCPLLFISHEHDEDNDYDDDPSYYYPNTNTHGFGSTIYTIRITVSPHYSAKVFDNHEDLHIISANPPNAPSDPDHKDRRTKTKAEYQTPKQEVLKFYAIEHEHSDETIV